MSTLPLPHPSFFVPSSTTSLSAAATARAPFRTRRKSPTMMSGAMAMAWLAHAQPALLVLVRARLTARHADAHGLDVACQLLVQFLEQVGRQQALPTMAATDLEQALWRANAGGAGATIDPTISQWVASTAASAEGIDFSLMATAVAGAIAEETARLMQAIVAILLDPTAATKSA
ncbi:MAG: hypothetical protein IPL79_14530 [Myxococcales bacterium]|nr:hypothetical protein [Myxococcales bacterium]